MHAGRGVVEEYLAVRNLASHSTLSTTTPTTTTMSLPSSFKQYTVQGAGIESLTVVDAPLPALKANEVLVKIKAVSLQYRDLMVVSGGYRTPVLPNVVPCSDGAGEIVSLGAEVKGWKVGDRVHFFLDHLDAEGMTPEIAQTALGGAAHGVLAEYRAFPAHSLLEIPAHLSYEEASTLPCAALTAYTALSSGPHGHPLKAGDTVLIQGTGGVSIFALQFAVASGASTIVLSSSDEKLALAAKLGARHVVNYNTTPEWAKEAKKLTNGRGVDRVVDVVGNATLALGGVLGEEMGSRARVRLPLRVRGRLRFILQRERTLDANPAPWIIIYLKSLSRRGVCASPVPGPAGRCSQIATEDGSRVWVDAARCGLQRDRGLEMERPVVIGDVGSEKDQAGVDCGRNSSRDRGCGVDGVWGRVGMYGVDGDARLVPRLGTLDASRRAAPLKAVDPFSRPPFSSARDSERRLGSCSVSFVRVSSVGWISASKEREGAGVVTESVVVVRRERRRIWAGVEGLGDGMDFGRRTVQVLTLGTGSVTTGEDGDGDGIEIGLGTTGSVGMWGRTGLWGWRASPTRLE
ncbi:Alcohol dehydrogenase superfamily protein [Mycena chlorophos]|uniref:Alcohol dehydrogenase superfamily protein n=1 Tax=Mycena chlorophos TaxID=658473 RepID=A0A8H6TKC0_MYCCL|nr:Alcohol dehydrogenase superfamily protein [Mycena chlorophos]